MPPTPTQRRYRRVTYNDSPTQFNRVTAPVGTYLPNPLPFPAFNQPGNVPRPPYSNPSTAAAGSLGAPFGATPARLPFSSPGAASPYRLPTGAVNIAGSAPAPLFPASGGVPNLSPGSLSPNTTYPGLYRPPSQSAPATLGGSFLGWNAQNAALASRTQTGQGIYQASERGVVPASGQGIGTAPNFGFSPTATFQNIAYRIAQGDENVSQAEQEQVMRIFEQSASQTPTTQEAGTGRNIAATDFTSTGFYQQYQAQGTAFENQLRWDPERRQYIRIGRLINEGRLDVRDRRARLRRSRAGRQRAAEQAYIAPAPEQAAATEQTPSFPGSFGVVSFNTATG